MILKSEALLSYTYITSQTLASSYQKVKHDNFNDQEGNLGESFNYFFMINHSKH